MYKFLTDENVSFSLITALRKKGYNVKDIKEEKLFGISDIEIINLANKEDRVIITHDKDFSNLLNYPLQKHKGVILIRYTNQSPKNTVKYFLPTLELLKNKIKKSLVIVTDDKIIRKD